MIHSDNIYNKSMGEYEFLPDLLPLLDIIFLIVVFLILTSNSTERALDLVLPEKGVEQAEPLSSDERITLTVYPEGQGWRVGDQRLQQWQAVQQAVVAAHTSKPAARWVIAADRTVALERFLEVLSLLKAEGLETAQILMSQEEQGSDER